MARTVVSAQEPNRLTGPVIIVVIRRNTNNQNLSMNYLLT
jgi:hypothetical protein